MLKIGQLGVGQRVDCSIDDVRAPVPDAQRITIASRASDPADADVAARAGHILDDDRLPERGPHALAEKARDRVGWPPGRIRHDHRDGTRGIGLCPRDLRHDRERGSARCHMEKLTTREVHIAWLRDAAAERTVELVVTRGTFPPGHGYFQTADGSGIEIIDLYKKQRVA